MCASRSSRHSSTTGCAGLDLAGVRKSSFRKISFENLDYQLRPIRPDDFEALLELAAASADTGRVGYAVRYARNPIEAGAVLQPEREWVVAEADGRLVGAGQVTFSETEVEGERHRCATLSSLMVHAAYRRRGIARALTRWRLDRAGPDAVVVAAIQGGNEGSVANARSWANQIFGSITIPVAPARSGRPNRRGLELRDAGDRDWEAAGAGVDAFERGWNLRTPVTGESLRGRVERGLGDERVRRYRVAVGGGTVVGGYELFEGPRLQTIVIERLPLALRALTLALRMLPRDRVLRECSVSGLWFAAGRTDVGRALWNDARATAAETGNTVSVRFDARGPLAAVVPHAPWRPKGSATVAVRSPVRLDEERLLAPP